MIVDIHEPKKWNEYMISPKLKSALFVAILIVVALLAAGIFFKKGMPVFGRTVIERTDLSLERKARPDDYDGYRDFIERNGQQQRPVSSEEYLKQIKEAQGYLKVHPSGKTAKDLKKKIVEALHIDFLLRGLDQRALTVTKIAERFQKGFIEEELLFEDPQVGVFSVLFLIPDQREKSRTAIIGLHGHDASAEIFKNTCLGKALALQGFPVIMPTFRSFAIPVDVVMNEELYTKSFTLMGLRVYETLLLIKYLKYKDYKKIGIMGHSAGSDVAYLIAIISRDLKALVYDWDPTQLAMLKGGTPQCDALPGKAYYPHCEVIPELAYYGPQINSAAALRIPSRKFRYKYPGPGDPEGVYAFFEENLTEK